MMDFRRTNKILEAVNSDNKKTSEYFIYDDQNEIGEVDQNNNITQLRILSDGDNAEIGSGISLK